MKKTGRGLYEGMKEERERINVLIINSNNLKISVNDKN